MVAACRAARPRWDFAASLFGRRTFPPGGHRREGAGSAPAHRFHSLLAARPGFEACRPSHQLTKLPREPCRQPKRSDAIRHLSWLSSAGLHYRIFIILTRTGPRLSGLENMAKSGSYAGISPWRLDGLYGRRLFRMLENHASVGAAKAEGIRHGKRDLAAARLMRHQVDSSRHRQIDEV